ncbi:FtsX-like permease family protein [Clostridium sp. UBA1056]|uniref:FtsX-like permease family protein n=1 Tax=unclassified Clostridium TaxID=2614128 RepID=UPI003217CE3E
MKLSKIAFKNLKRNFSFYSLYLFSVSFVLMIFFCFISFSKNEVIMECISSDGRVETMCRTVAVFVMAFVIFYMSYSNKFFMRRRMKELGVYALLGYRKSAMLKLLTIENVFICIGGLIIGIVTGSLLHKGLTVGITVLLDLSIDINRIPFINSEAVSFSLLFVLAVIFALTLSNTKLLWKSTLLDLVRLEKKTEKPIKIRNWLAVIGAILLVAGYALALDITKGKSSVWHTIGFSPIALLTMLCVVSGTALFIYSFLPYVCKQIKKHKRKLYHENTIIVVPKFMHRIRSNAKSLILLILLSAGTLTILGSTILSTWYPIAALERIIPAGIEFRVTNAEQSEQALAALDQAVGGDNYQIYETKILKTTATSDKLPIEYNVSADKGREPGFECISESDYASLLKLQGKQLKIPDLKDKDCALIKYRPDQSDIGAVYHLDLGKGESADLTVTDISLQNPIGFGNSISTLVVSDGVYKAMEENGISPITVMSIGGENIRSSKVAYEAIYSIMPDNPYLVSAYQRQKELVHLNSSTLLLICFATVIFLIATGSILYFQNISAVTYDKDDYEIMSKMGYSTPMIKKAIRRQTQIYFLIPYVLGLLHSIFALICYKSALMDDLLGKSSAVMVPIIFSIALFSVIYMIYYQVTKYSCYKIALS